MKIIHSGGVNGSILNDNPQYSIYGFGNYFMLQIRNELEDLIREHKTIAVCVAAKSNKNHYDQRFIDMGFNLQEFIFIGRDDKPKWEQFDAILILGGETRELHAWLTESKFNIARLKRCKLIAGDSAGAYVLGKHTLIDYEADGSRFKIIDGFIPELNILIAAHVNNDHYHKGGLDAVLREWCKNNKVEYVSLEENEIKITELLI